MSIRLHASGAYHPVRFLYLGYYLKKLDWSKYKKFLRYFNRDSGRSSLRLAAGSLIDSLAHNVSLLEYFQFGYPNLQSDDKGKWAGSGYMYEYQRVMNPPSTRQVLDDKREFFKKYHKFFVHRVFTFEELESDPSMFEVLSNTETGKIVIKASDGKCGAQVKVVDVNDTDRSDLISTMRDGGYDMAEEFVMQHSDIQVLAPTAVNTVRIITQLNVNDEVEVLGCRFRISVSGDVDNLAAGNLAAPVDEQTGVVCGPGIYDDITKLNESVHPITGTSIVGFQIPFWSECVALAKNAALHDISNRSIGWDIVVTENGPGLIEGNHDWCKLVWQLPVATGLRPVLDKHWVEYVAVRAFA